jgi:pyrroloquinoline quinone biosynthesis protein D
LSDDRVPRLIRNARLSESPGQGDMLLMPEGVLRLKGTGAEIVGLCDGRRTVAEILAELKARFPRAAPAELEADALAFLDQLREKRVLDF